MPLDLDAAQENADWSKQSWDLPVDSPEELYYFLAERGMSIRQFTQLPVYTENVDKIPWLAGLGQPPEPGPAAAGLPGWSPATHPVAFAERVWVPPHSREGKRVKGYWREGLPGRGTSEPLPRARSRGALKVSPSLLQKIQEVGLNDPPAPGPVSRKLLTDETGKLHPDTQALHSREELVPSVVQGKGGVHMRVVQKPGRVYSAERRKLHDKIVKAHLKGKQPDPGGRRMMFLAGGTASGKSSQKRGRPDLRNFVDIDPDTIKEMLPEYGQMRDANERYATQGVHEESSDIAKMIQAEAMRRKLNVLVDGTGDAEKGKFLGKMRDADERGYKVEVILADVPTETAIDRMIERGKRQGRFVPVKIVREIHRGVAARHKEWRSQAFLDHWEVWDNDGSQPVLLAEGGGGNITVHEKDLYEKFMAKADEDESAPLEAAA